jgi:hypothetical protein
MEIKLFSCHVRSAVHSATNILALKLNLPLRGTHLNERCSVSSDVASIMLARSLMSGIGVVKNQLPCNYLNPCMCCT